MRQNALFRRFAPYESRLPCHSDLRSARVASACCGRASHTFVTRFWRLRELRTQIRCAKIRSSGREFVTCTRLRADQMCQIRYSVARCAPYALRSHCTPCKSHHRGRLTPCLLRLARVAFAWSRRAFAPAENQRFSPGDPAHTFVTRCAPYALRSHCTPCKSHHRGRLMPCLLRSARVAFAWSRRAFAPAENQRFSPGDPAHTCVTRCAPYALRSHRTPCKSHHRGRLAPFICSVAGLYHSMPRRTA